MSLFDISNSILKLKALEKETNNPDFWNNNSSSAVTIKEINNLKSKIEGYNKTKTQLENIIEMNELVKEEKEESLEEELIKSIKLIENQIDKLEINTFLPLNIHKHIVPLLKK